MVLAEDGIVQGPSMLQGPKQLRSLHCPKTAKEISYGWHTPYIL